MPSDDDEDVSVKDETASGVPSSAEKSSADTLLAYSARFHPRGGGRSPQKGGEEKTAADASPAAATPNTGFLFARYLSPNAMRDVGDASDHNGTDPEQRDESADTVRATVSRDSDSGLGTPTTRTSLWRRLLLWADVCASPTASARG